MDFFGGLIGLGILIGIGIFLVIFGEVKKENTSTHHSIKKPKL